MIEFCQYSRRQRIVLRNRTERLSELLDWKNLSSVSLMFGIDIFWFWHYIFMLNFTSFYFVKTNFVKNC